MIQTYLPLKIKKVKNEVLYVFYVTNERNIYVYNKTNLGIKKWQQSLLPSSTIANNYLGNKNIKKSLSHLGEKKNSHSGFLYTIWYR